MIYNLIQYLRNQFPTETIRANMRYKTTDEKHIPDRVLLIMETGGPADPITKFTTKTIQVTARDFDPPKARALAYLVYELFFNTGTFGLILPLKVVDGVTFPAIQTSQISAIQEPESMGADNEGRTRFINNYQIIYTRST